MSQHQGLKVLCTFPFDEEALEKIREAAQSEVVVATRDEELAAHAEDVEVICGFWLPKNIRQLAPRLRWLQFAGAGVDGLRDTGLLDPASGVIVTTASGIHASTIGEYVFGSMIMFNRSWPELVRLQDRHVWGNTAWYHLRTLELYGQTLGIIGVGHIGRYVARLGRAFGMRVLGVRRSARGGEQDQDVERYYAFSQLREMLPLCDYIVIATPLTPETERLIGEPELRAMRRTAYLVNVARGRIIDEQALIRALREGWIAGAGLDVTEVEPLPPDSPLYSLPNVILTPHISGESVHYGARLASLFVDNLQRYRRGEPLRNRYDPQRGY
ncbi:MAG: D-2-hydroxyacid dehydrogenase [Thermogemmatispora sp.]|uniref:D-2-hydroxyacid dehydrogenase n=1 Tax=Thermogemmatispora sp. TaxID=1968838 RepID=UPI00261E1B8F|nr:D-2-hydroxyacid dehydrogenase [Thermogemmatispora sp.]MBX5457811.1 D-2-hydroxyacid dehydrogenase [Thermogemmatispora sp.]